MLFLETNSMLKQSSHWKSKKFKAPLEQIIQCFSGEYKETSDKIWIFSTDNDGRRLGFRHGFCISS
jgi:hypothetical protein